MILRVRQRTLYTLTDVLSSYSSSLWVVFFKDNHRLLPVIIYNGPTIFLMINIKKINIMLMIIVNANVINLSRKP